MSLLYVLCNLFKAEEAYCNILVLSLMFSLLKDTLDRSVKDY